MSNEENGGKIANLIPKDRYVYITYAVILASAGLGLLISLLALVGVLLPLGQVVGVLALMGLFMALGGYFGYKEEFNAIDQNHLFYLCVLFGAFFVLNLILASALAYSGIVGSLILLIIAGAEAVLIFAGFNAHMHGRTMTLSKDALISEVQLAIKRS